MSEDYDMIFKVLLVGPARVGKTSLINKFVLDTFDPEYKSTIGIDFTTKSIEVDGKRIKLQIWDTAGQERFSSITRAYYRGAHGIILLYDITDRQSFDGLAAKLDSALAESSPDIKVVLVGTRADELNLKERQVPLYEAQQLAESKGCVGALEISAKDGTNVDQAFLKLTTSIYHYKLSQPQVSTE